MTTPKKRGRRPLAASVVRLELRAPELLARMAEERAKSRDITTAELWREAMHAHLGQPKETRKHCVGPRSCAEEWGQLESLHNRLAKAAHE